MASKLEFGMLWINDHHRLDPASPWGGFKNSGVGRETSVAVTGLPPAALPEMSSKIAPTSAG